METLQNNVCYHGAKEEQKVIFVLILIVLIVRLHGVQVSL